jgi:hypothetical protein
MLAKDWSPNSYTDNILLTKIICDVLITVHVSWNSSHKIIYWLTLWVLGNFFFDFAWSFTNYFRSINVIFWEVLNKKQWTYLAFARSWVSSSAPVKKERTKERRKEGKEGVSSRSKQWKTMLFGKMYI